MNIDRSTRTSESDYAPAFIKLDYLLLRAWYLSYIHALIQEKSMLRQLFDRCAGWKFPIISCIYLIIELTEFKSAFPEVDFIALINFISKLTVFVKPSFTCKGNLNALSVEDYPRADDVMQRKTQVNSTWKIGKSWSTRKGSFDYEKYFWKKRQDRRSSDLSEQDRSS